jgi:hypothetical protein
MYVIILINDYCSCILKEVHLSVHNNDGSSQLIHDLINIDLAALKASFIYLDLLKLFFQVLDPYIFVFIFLAVSLYIFHIGIHKGGPSYICCYRIFSNISCYGDTGDKRDRFSFCHCYFLHLFFYNPSCPSIIVEAP